LSLLLLAAVTAAAKKTISWFFPQQEEVMSHDIALSESVMFAQNVLVREAACHFNHHPKKHPNEMIPLPDWYSMVMKLGNVSDDERGAHREIVIRANGADEFGGEVNVHFNVTLQLFKPKGEKKWKLERGTGTLEEPMGKWNWGGNDCPNGGGASVWKPTR